VLDSPFVSFVVQLAMMLSCGLLGGAALRAVRLPPVIGEIIGGIVIGPTVFGALTPSTHAVWFPSTGLSADLRQATVRLGMLFFMFIVGLEMNLRGLRRHAAAAVTVGLAGTLAPAALGIAVVYAVPQLFPAGDAVHRSALALFMGAALANTAVPVLARILLDLGLLKGRLGGIIMSAAVVDDLVSWTLLFAVLQVFGAGHSLGEPAPSLGGSLVAIGAFFVLTIVAARMAAAWFTRRGGASSTESVEQLGITAIGILLSGAAAEAVGMHAFLGPLLFGAALMPTPAAAESPAYTTIRRFTHGFFAPIYFVSLGSTTDFVGSFHWDAVLLVLAAATLGKVPAVYAAARFSSLARREAWAVGLGMNARGAIGIILAELGLEKGIIEQPIYVALVAMAVATSLVAGPAMKACLRETAKL